MNLVATGGATDLTQLGNYESAFNEGDRGVLEIGFNLPIPSDWAQGIKDNLISRGVELWGDGVSINQKTAQVQFKKGIAPLVIIAIAIAAVVVIIAIVVAWKLWNAGGSQTAGGITSFFSGIGALPWIIGIGAVLIIGLLVWSYRPKWW